MYVRVMVDGRNFQIDLREDVLALSASSDGAPELEVLLSRLYRQVRKILQDRQPAGPGVGAMVHDGR